MFVKTLRKAGALPHVDKTLGAIPRYLLAHQRFENTEIRHCSRGGEYYAVLGRWSRHYLLLVVTIFHMRKLYSFGSDNKYHAGTEN